MAWASRPAHECAAGVDAASTAGLETGATFFDGAPASARKKRRLCASGRAVRGTARRVSAFGQQPIANCGSQEDEEPDGNAFGSGGAVQRADTASLSSAHDSPSFVCSRSGDDRRLKAGHYDGLAGLTSVSNPESGSDAHYYHGSALHCTSTSSPGHPIEADDAAGNGYRVFSSIPPGRCRSIIEPR